MNENLQAIILAAGKSTRFNTHGTKLTETICGQAMIVYPIKLLKKLAIPTTVVVGYQKELVQKTIDTQHDISVTYVIQEEQKGTGHALMCTQSLWDKRHILVLNGDAPLITPDIINSLYTEHITTNAAVSFISSCNPDPTSKSYGRVVRTQDSIEIVEAKDFTGDTHEHCCINAGIYLIDKDFLIDAITQLTNNNASKELYITDLVKIASNSGFHVAKVSAPFDSIRGINTFQELWAAEHIKRSELITYWMERGVRFSVAQNVHIDLDVKIGAGSYIGCGVHLEGNTSLGKNCKIQEFASLENVTVDDDVIIYPFCIIKNAHIQSHSHVGPFVHIHDNVTIEPNSTIGNFIELKNTGNDEHKKIQQLNKPHYTEKPDAEKPLSFIAARVMHNDAITPDE